MQFRVFYIFPSGPSFGLVFFILSTLLVFAGPVVGEEKQAPPEVEKIFAGKAPLSVADLKAMQQRIRELTEKIVPCTVGVRVGNAQGSGVIISQDGYVLSVAHVVGQPGREVFFTFSDGSTARGKTLGMNTSIDAGLMKIEGDKKWPFVEMGKSSNLKEGQWCLVTGHPGGLMENRPPVLRVGRIIDVRKFSIFTDCALVSGDSGGPLFDFQGKVIGVNSRIGNRVTTNIHVPIDSYRKTWDRLVAGESWEYLPGQGPYIGVEGDPDSNAAKIDRVRRNSPAAKAGIQAGDVIIRFGGQTVDDFDTLKNLVRSKEPGEQVIIEVQRGEDKLKLKLIIRLFRG